MLQMNRIRTICVYCGSGPGSNPRYIESAKALGKALADGGIRLVFGGGSLGLMGALANSVLDHGGMVTGIIPDFLTMRENALTRVQEMVVTPDMHERADQAGALGQFAFGGQRGVGMRGKIGMSHQSTAWRDRRRGCRFLHCIRVVI